VPGRLRRGSRRGGDHERAARLLGAAERLLSGMGATLKPYEQRLSERGAELEHRAREAPIRRATSGGSHVFRPRGGRAGDRRSLGHVVEELGTALLGRGAVDEEDELVVAGVPELEDRPRLDDEDAATRNLVPLGRLAEVDR
jgi:hypothetical protein